MEGAPFSCSHKQTNRCAYGDQVCNSTPPAPLSLPKVVSVYVRANRSLARHVARHCVFFLYCVGFFISRRARCESFGGECFGFKVHNIAEGSL